MPYISKQAIIAYITYIFENNPISFNVYSFDLAGSVCNILHSVIVENAIAVPTYGDICLPINWAIITTIPIIVPLNKTACIVPPANILSFGSLGAFVIIFFSGFSNPRDIAGRESVIKFINNSCNVVNGFDQLANTANNIAIIPAKFHANN